MDNAERLRRLYANWSTDPLARRDPAFIREELEWLGPLLDTWFQPTLEGFEHLPEGRVLVVGMHNGGTLSPDMFVSMVGFWRHCGVERPSYGLAHDLVFRMPLVGRWIARLGGVPARRDHAEMLLARDAAVLVYPGGDIDAFKPYSERHVVKFGERSGFIKTALAARAPIVPIVSVGAHETFRVLTDGRDLAARLGLKRLLRIEVLPVILCLPWGLWIGPVEGHVPVPSRVRVRALPAMHFDGDPADEEYVREAREGVRRAMQSAVDELVAAGNFGPLARLAHP